jgi:hypothetical protein
MVLHVLLDNRVGKEGLLSKILVKTGIMNKGIVFLTMCLKFRPNFVTILSPPCLIISNFT